MNCSNTGKLTGDLRSFLTGEQIGRLGSAFLVLVHSNDRVFFSRENGKELSALLKDLSSDSLKELRAFNETGELRLWKMNDEIRWRLRIDDEKNENIYEELHVLWGDKIGEKSCESVLLSESGRGFLFRIPPFAENPSLPLKMLVRNYFDFEEDGLLRFYDARIVSLMDKEERELKWRA